MVAGGTLTACAFFISGILELQLAVSIPIGIIQIYSQDFMISNTFSVNYIIHIVALFTSYN